MSGLLHLIENDDLSREEFLSYSQQLRGNFEYVQFTLNNLLQWALSQLKGPNTDPSEFQLFELIAENTNFLSEQAKTKDILLLNEVDSSHYAFADRNQINVVLRNVVSNAIKFTGSGGSITFSSMVKERGDLEISIRDSGVGMSASVVNAINDSNCSPISTIGTSGEKGTGMELLLCKEMVVRNGGTFSVQSKEKAGTTVGFTLPARIPYPVLRGS